MLCSGTPASSQCTQGQPSAMGSTQTRPHSLVFHVPHRAIDRHLCSRSQRVSKRKPQCDLKGRFFFSSKPRQPAIRHGYLQEIRDALSAATGRGVTSCSPQESKNAKLQRTALTLFFFFFPSSEYKSKDEEAVEGSGRLCSLPDTGGREAAVNVICSGQETSYLSARAWKYQGDTECKLHGSTMQALNWAALCPAFRLA